MLAYPGAFYPGSTYPGEHTRRVEPEPPAVAEPVNRDPLPPTWRFYLLSLPGREWIDKDLPLVGASVATSISAPASISGSVKLGYDQITGDDGLPIIHAWDSMLIADRPGMAPVAAIIDKVSPNGDNLDIEAGGFTMYAKDMPWMGEEYTGIEVDPLDIYRMVWDELQWHTDGDLGIAVDDTTTPVRVGEKKKDVKFQTGAGEDVAFEAGPYKLAHWETDDLGQKLDDLAESTPFEYREDSAWSGEDIKLRIELGYPKLGVRRPNLWFEIGVNVTAPPPIEEGEYASEVLLLGAGEGRKRIDGHATNRIGRLRRVKVETDKSLRRESDAARKAQKLVKRLTGQHNIDSLEVIDYGGAPYGTFNPGDEIRVQGDAGWIDLDMWVRILDMEIDCDTDKMTLSVEAS